MADRGKVIEGLECIMRSTPKECVKVCGGAYKCARAVAKDAVKLLRETEPKLLTIEEITGDGECWFEGINGACGYADCYMCTGSKEVEVHRISMKPEYVSLDDFKKKWRCWSYRPTDEQRQVVKWNG